VNKFLVASGAACALVSGSVMAQSSVTLYGVADAGLLYQGDPITGHGSRYSLSGGGQGASIWGLLGSEDLGGGLKAVFQIESSYSIANGQTTLGAQFGRVAKVGLTSRYGDFYMGRQYTPLYSQALLAGDAFDQFLVGFVGTLFSAYPRANNSVLYKTPDLYGFTSSVMYSFGGVAGDFQAGRAYSGAISYVRGPLRLNVGYFSSNDATGAFNSHGTSISGNYDFGPVNVFSETQFIRSDLNGVPGSTKADTNANAYSLGVRIPISIHRMIWQVSYLTDQRHVANSDGHALFIAFGFYYNLSKATNLYFSAGHVFNKGSVTYSVADNTSTPYGQTAVSFGLRHRF
jgi:general bacterial porin, GBP family